MAAYWSRMAIMNWSEIEIRLPAGVGKPKMFREKFMVFDLSSIRTKGF